jgi:preprotein translocase subunit YajC
MISAPFLLALLQAPAPSAGSTFTPLIVQFGLIFLIFYFLIIRPQQKQRKRHEEALRTMKRGDRIVTAGGIVAEVVHIKESVKDGKPTPGMDDEVTIKSGESRLIIERGRISKIHTDGGTVSAPPMPRGKGGSAE